MPDVHVFACTVEGRKINRTSQISFGLRPPEAAPTDSSYRHYCTSAGYSMCFSGHLIGWKLQDRAMGAVLWLGQSGSTNISHASYTAILWHMQVPV